MTGPRPSSAPRAVSFVLGLALGAFAAFMVFHLISVPVIFGLIYGFTVKERRGGGEADQDRGGDQ